MVDSSRLLDFASDPGLRFFQIQTLEIRLKTNFEICEKSNENENYQKLKGKIFIRKIIGKK
jgi:hypothetical protein